MIHRRWSISIALGCSLLALLVVPAAAQQAREDDGPFQALTFRDARLRPQAAIAPFEAVQNELPPEVRDGWAGFLIGTAPGWQGEVDRRNGYLEFAEGAGLPWIPGAGNNLIPAEGGKVDLPALEKIARGFVPRIAKMFGIDPAELRLSPGRSGQVGDVLWLVDFDVVREGKTVEGARVVFRINNGNLVQLGTENLPPLDAAVPSERIDRKQALAVLTAYLGGVTQLDRFSDQGSLHLLPVAPDGAEAEAGFAPGAGRELALVWDFVFRRRGVTGTWRARVDATAGKVIAFEDLNDYAQANGGVYPQSVLFNNETVLPMPYADVSSGGFTDSAGWYTFPGGTTSSALNGQYVHIGDQCGPISQTSSGTGKITFGTSSGTDCATPGSGGPGNTHAARTQFYHVNRIKEVGRAWLPSNTWLQGQLGVNVNISQTCNAYWNGYTLNFFRSGSGCANTGEIAGVSLHEYGHGLDQNDGNGFSPDNGTGEAYADITAAIMLHSSCEGPGFFQSGNCGGYGDSCTSCSGVRDIDWAKHSSATAHTVGNFTQLHCGSGGGYDGPCGGEGHCESYVISEAMWDLAARDLPAPGTAAAWTIAERLWYLSRPTSSSAFVCHTGTPTWTSDGCATGSLWRTLRAADDDDGNLSNGTPHSCQIFAALNRHGLACAGDAGANICFSACTPPTAPTVNLIPDNRQVQVSWSSSGAGTVYDVYRSEAGCDAGFVKIADNTGGTSLLDTHVANGLTYSYRVVSQPTGNEACAAAPSACQSTVPVAPPCPSLSAPTGVNASSGTVDRISLSWNAVATATEYHIYRATSFGGPYQQVGTVAAPATTFLNTGLAAGTTYYYVVKAAVDECESAGSSPVFASTSACQPLTLYSNDFESGSGRADWTVGIFAGSSDADWRGIATCSAHAGTHDFRFGGPNCGDPYNAAEFLYAQPQGATGIAVPANAALNRLSFWHREDFESGFDGGTLVVSVDGVHYAQVPATAIVGGQPYNGQIINDCPPGNSAGAPSFTGHTSSFVQSVVDLDAACNAATGTNTGCAGRSVRVGFAAVSDCIVLYTGWQLDDVQVTACLPHACTGAPSIGTATTPANNQVQLTWSQGAPASTSFRVYRALGTCAVNEGFAPLSTVSSPGYLDNDVSGGTTYAYRVAGLDSTGTCESDLSACVEATGTGPCTLLPSFAGLATAIDPSLSTCTLNLTWNPAVGHCGGPVTYDVFRSTTPGFTPSPANRVATGLTSTGYGESELDPGQTYYYAVRAVDSVSGASDGNSVIRSATTTGPLLQVLTLSDTFEDADGFDLSGWSHTALTGTADWQWTTTVSQTASHSWYSPSQNQANDRILVSPSFRATPTSALTFWHTYDFESSYDGGTLEISTNDGLTWTVLPDAAFQSGGFNGTLYDNENPIGGKRAWTGALAGFPTMSQVKIDLSAWAGSRIRLRWHAGEDGSVAHPGWYVDSVKIYGAEVGGLCRTDPPAALDFYSLPPCRLIDTRNPAGPLGGPAILPGDERLFTVAGACGVPADAKALSVNLTAVTPGANGNLTLFPSDQVTPLASLLNYQTGVTRANNALILLSDTTGAIRIRANTVLPLDFVLDVNGYFK